MSCKKTNFATYALCALLALNTFPALAQQTIADLKTQIAAASAELDQIDELLSDVDPNRRAAAMDALMASGNPSFIERAVEVGLFSSDPRMRAAALKQALSSGGPFTLEVDLTDADEEKTVMREWLGSYGGGTWNEEKKSGSSIFRTGKFDEKNNCWPFSTGNKCAFVVDGERVSLQGWDYAAGDLTLMDDGILRGFFRYTYNNKGTPVPASIRLVD